MLLGAGPALAHAGLAGSDPIDGEALSASPPTVELSFNQPVPPEFATVAITGNGSPVTLPAPTVDGAIVRQAVPALANGAYVVAYRVVSADGHPVTGEIKFTVEAPDQPMPSSASAAAADLPPASAAESESGSGSSIVLWVVIAAAVIAAAVFLVLRMSRGSDR
ncbi:MAG: hypothetical protein ABS81_11520 [Pseudonocardia sp. SCN 72-86]|nr:MAG: hypothetical protein ABS81_11520 [Pseudonocardia sp. SCN 72-86]